MKTPPKNPLFADRYEQIRPLGEGEYAVTHQAIDHDTGEHVALKVLKWMNDPMVRVVRTQQLRREADLLASFTHPQIPRFREVGTHRGQIPFLAMEYKPGPSLARLLTTHVTTPVRLARYFLQIANIVNYLHQQGIVHRDLTPDNLLVEQIEGREQVALIDFGLAWSSCDHPELPTPEGRTGYAPSEQIYGRERWPHLSDDLRTLGVSFYVLLTHGRHPYGEGGWTMESIDWGLRPFIPLSHIDPTIPPTLAAVVEKLGARPLSRAYRTSEELASDLCRVVAGLRG